MELGPQAGTVCTLLSAEGAMSVQGTTTDSAAQGVCGASGLGGRLDSIRPKTFLLLSKVTSHGRRK